MLIGLAIRDVVLIETLDLAPGPGLTALTGETGAGKSIILGALGLAIGERGDAALVRRGAAQAQVAAAFAPPADAPVWALMEEKGFAAPRDEALILRRVLGADGRSRAFVGDQPAAVGLLRELGAAMVEVHGQHETLGLLDARAHAAILDRFGGTESLAQACGAAWAAWRAAAETARASLAERDRSATLCAELSESLAELDRLAPLAGEASRLTDTRRVMSAAQNILADVAQARDHLEAGAPPSRLGQAYRALSRARQRLPDAGPGEDGEAPIGALIAAAAEAVDRTLAEAAEAAAAIDAAAAALAFEPDALERAEERLHALRAMARRLEVEPDELAAARAGIAARLLGAEAADETSAADQARAGAALAAYGRAAAHLTTARRAAAARLARAVEAELVPLKLDKARFRVAVEALAADRHGPGGADRVAFQIATTPGAPFQSLGAIASGGELARFALALKVCLAAAEAGAAGAAGRPQPLMIFDEVDQGWGGAVADAVGSRLQRLAAQAQVLVVTHSPQVAARADAQWRVRKIDERVAVDVLAPDAREEEIARMLSGARITEAARAAARALMHA